jgi:hypothetical protein
MSALYDDMCTAMDSLHQSADSLAGAIWDRTDIDLDNAEVAEIKRLTAMAQYVDQRIARFHRDNARMTPLLIDAAAFRVRA